MSPNKAKVLNFLKACESVGHVPDYDEIAEVTGVNRNTVTDYVRALRREGKTTLMIAQRVYYQRKFVIPQPPGHDPGKSGKVCTIKGCVCPRAAKSQFCERHTEAWLARCRHS